MKILIPVWSMVCLTLVNVVVAVEPVITFDQVQPVLKKRCGSCHGGSQPRGDLDVSAPDRIRAGSGSGPVVVPGKPEESLLFTLAAHLEDPIMPPGAAKIPLRELDLLHGWIAGGLQERPKPTATSEPRVASVASRPMATPVVPAAVSVAPIPRASAITALAASPSAPWVAVSGTRQVVLFEQDSTAPKKAFPFPEGEVHDLKFSQDGTWLVAAGGIPGETGKVVLFEVATGARIAEFDEERDAVLTVSLSTDRNWLAWGGPTRTIKLVRLADRQVVATLTGQTDWVLSVAFSPDGLLLAGSDRFGTTRVWETRSQRLFATLRGHTGAVPALAWSPDGDQLITAGEDETVRLWNLHTTSQSAMWEPGVGGVQAVDWHSSGVIAVAGRKKQVALLAADGHPLRSLSLEDEAIAAVWGRAADQVFVADAGGSLRGITRSTGQPQSEYSLPKVAVVDAESRHWPKRSRPVPRLQPVTAKPAGGDVSAESALRQALLDTESAIQATETSLMQLKEAAARLRQQLEQRPASPASR